MREPTNQPSTAEQLQDLIVESEDVDKFLEELAILSSKILGGEVEVHCGVTLKRRRRRTTAASSSAEARKLDEIQYGYDQGPCLHAIATERTTIVTDARTDGRWPDYFAAIVEHGYYSMLGVPIVLTSGGGAALNFYAKEPDTFQPETVKVAEGYALQTAKALELALRVAAHMDTATDLKAAMESRTSIDMAVGVIMAQNGCGQDEAFEILTRASNGQNVKLRVLAEQLIGSLSDEPPKTHFS